MSDVLRFPVRTPESDRVALRDPAEAVSDIRRALAEFADTVVRVREKDLAARERLTAGLGSLVERVETLEKAAETAEREIRPRAFCED